MLITDDLKELASALEDRIREAWDADHDPNPSPEATERAKQATYDLAGLVMHNSVTIVAALRESNPRLVKYCEHSWALKTHDNRVSVSCSKCGTFCPDWKPA